MSNNTLANRVNQLESSFNSLLADNAELKQLMKSIEERLTLTSEVAISAQHQADSLQQFAKVETSDTASNVRDLEAGMTSPEFFDGDRTKLVGFLGQLSLIFDLQPSQYALESTKVKYAALFLRGTAQRWLQPYLLASPQPEILRNFALFSKELRQNFGDPDEIATAERNLIGLEQTGTAAAYVSEFKHLAIILGWDSSSLGALFYRGLKDSVKDEITRIGRPTSFQTLMEKAIILDNRITERNIERGYSQPQTTPRSYRPSAPSPAYQPSLTAAPIKQRSSPQTAKRNNSSELLTKSGKLIPQEYERRIKHNLCVYCGDASHKVDRCPLKKSRSSASANAASSVPKTGVNSSHSGNV